MKALVRTIHQELCDPELLGRLAPVCKELGTAAVDEATRMLSGIGLPVEAVMPEERVLTDRSHKPYPPQKRPPGLFPRLACLRVFEGLRVRCEVAELAERLRAMGAVVVTEAQQRAHVARFEGRRRVGATLGNCHEDTCMHAHAVASTVSEDGVRKLLPGSFEVSLGDIDAPARHRFELTGPALTLEAYPS